MRLFALLSLGLWALNWAIMGWGTWLAFRLFRKKNTELQPTDLQPVSILKPLKGIDEGLYENLESFFQIRYPKYELLFSVTEENEPAIPLIQKLMEKYPEVDASLVCAPQAVGFNPKIANLMSVYDRTKYDLVLISDSNIRVRPRYLLDLIPDLKGSTGIITAIVAGVSPRGVGGWLEASYLNTFFTRWMVVTKKIGFPSVIGKSMLFKKSTMQRFGGLKTLGHYIAEDYMAGHAIQKLDLKVELMRSPIDQYIGLYSFDKFWGRHLRWGRIRKSIAPLAFLIEPLFFSSVSGLIGAFALDSLFGFNWLGCWLLHLLIWGCLDSFIYSLMDRVSWKSLMAWAFRESLAVPLWVSILCGSTVFWRGKNYRLLRGGLLSGGTAE